MDIKGILSHVDHTLLNPCATLNQIKLLCDEGIDYNVASVCIPAAYVKEASEYVKNRLKICTVIGFPNGYSTTASKCFEASDAVKNGADEIDMVINLGWLKDKRYDDLLKEISAVKKSCGPHILKVIVETCLLSEDEKIDICNIVSDSGADYIKTSTGFSSGGATADDIKLFAANVSNGVRIKAAGGISTIEDAENFISLGADRLGTSRIVKLAKTFIF